jgi:TatD DNase family protein
MRGKTNEPSYTKYVAEFIANLKNIDVDEFANLSTKNFFTLFTKAKQR